jgi:hypothetical protein
MITIRAFALLASKCSAIITHIPRNQLDFAETIRADKHTFLPAAQAVGGNSQSRSVGQYFELNFKRSRVIRERVLIKKLDGRPKYCKTVNKTINTNMMIKKYSKGPRFLNGPFFMQAPSTSSSISIIIKTSKLQNLIFSTVRTSC